MAAPYDGAVTVTVAEGDTVEAGQTVATIEAMKMEASITAPVAGHREPARRPHDAGRGGRRPRAGDRLSQPATRSTAG